jgi:S-adenosylmethionine decarboxylase
MTESNALFQLGIDLNRDSSSTQAEVLEFPVQAPSEEAEKADTVEAGPYTSSDERTDFFIRLDDIEHIEKALRRCVEVSKATLLHIHLHHFTPNGGVSGVAVLSESHISIHSWPEADYAALDVFMCGEAEPHNAIEVLREAFSPSDIRVGEHLRGQDMV